LSTIDQALELEQNAAPDQNNRETMFATEADRDETEGDRPFAPRTIPEQVADELGSAIVSGRLKAGQRLVESNLAAEFGTSRGPIREAIRILERRRMVDMQPRRGAYVRAISLKSIADLFNTRMALSTLAVRSFARKPIESYIATLGRRIVEMQALVRNGDPMVFAEVTTRAVKTIARGSGNDLVVELLTDLANQTVWTTIWKSALDYQTRPIRKSAADDMMHVRDAVAAGDPASASERLSRLLEGDRDRALKTLSQIRVFRQDF
jgi:DNA-binding GntR family transcriptional regulator